MTVPTKRQPIPFGKYLLLDRVNIGGMAEVWRAKTFGAGGFERLVAIKRILPNIAEDEEFISMFIDEARITVQLNHANIAQIYELSHITNSYFIAMEYVSGRDLRAVFDRCRKRGEPAPIPLVCYVISRCCEGFDYAHRKKDGMGRDMNIVHRDVSPQNALVSFDGEVKVIDFGIAKAAGKATKTQAGILKGKFGYMSPEQIRGLPLDRRSDVFAIGVCLYELLTGERLFVGDSDFSVLEKVRKVEVLPPSHFNRKIDATLEKIVMKALAKDVDDRYQYASELGDDLQRFLVSGDMVFGRKDLAAFMKATFAEEFEKEKQRLQEYAEVQAPAGMVAAAEAGYGGAAPVGPPVLNPAPAGSAVTNVPTIAPSTLPPPSTRAPEPAPRASVPRLSAAPAAPTRERAEHAATQMVVSIDPPAVGMARAGVDATTDPGIRSSEPAAPPAAKPPPPVVPQTAPMPALDPATTNPDDLFDSTPAMGVKKVPMPAAERALPAARPAAPEPLFERSNSPTVPEPRTRRGPRTGLIVGAAIALLLVLALGAALFRSLNPPGLLLLDVPQGLTKEELARVSINIDGTELTDVTRFPTIRKVHQGDVTVMVVVPGYKPLIETVTVGPRGETRLKKLFEKEASAPAP